MERLLLRSDQLLTLHQLDSSAQNLFALPKLHLTPDPKAQLRRHE